MIPLAIPYMPYPDIIDKARGFLQTYNAHQEIPVDIEVIIEDKLGMDIIPFPNLQRDFSVEGFSSSDFSDIYVDEHIYRNVPVRYRFTLAHEVGHCVLHQQYLNQVKVTSIEQWKQFIEQVDPEDYGRMEFQGYAFAGLVLVPPHHLKRHFRDHLPEVDEGIREAKKAGLRRSDYLEYAREAMAGKLAPLFDVSQQTVIKRITFDGLDQGFP